MTKLKKIAYPRFILAATNSGAGKTTVSIAIMSALRIRGFKVAPFKAGPDYIDPGHHFKAAGTASRNLDSWLFSKRAVLELFQRQAKDADISVIEGVMGLYDGLKDTEQGSTAQLAKILKCPVILIINARSMSRSAGAIALGYAMFDKKVDIKGVILNNIASLNHYSYIKNAIEKKAKIQVLGYLPRNAHLNVPERHLGLVPAKEKQVSNNFYKSAAGLIEKSMDLDRIIAISKIAPRLTIKNGRVFTGLPVKSLVNIAVAYDEAFNFYYQDNLDMLKHFGARLINFSPLKDKALPLNIDGLYIGGGFPEIFAGRLSKNIKLKNEIYNKSKQGLPIYAECGGLMYLMQNLSAYGGGKKIYPMAGVFKGSVNMANRLRALGYVDINAVSDNILTSKGERFRGHVFHYSYLDKLARGQKFCHRLTKGKDVFNDGLSGKNVLAGYAHIHFASKPSLAKNFIKACREYQFLQSKSEIDTEPQKSLRRRANV